jgi:hypothetical protein
MDKKSIEAHLGSRQKALTLRPYPMHANLKPKRVGENA